LVFAQQTIFQSFAALIPTPRRLKNEMQLPWEISPEQSHLIFEIVATSNCPKLKMVYLTCATRQYTGQREVSNLHFTFRLMLEQDAHAIATWQYQKPSTFYDADQDPDDLAELLNPQSWQETYHSVLDEQKELIGFIPFNEDEGIIEIWLGLRPDLNGKGIGLEFVQAGLSCAKNTYSCTASF
jgi:hypothetical protein